MATPYLTGFLVKPSSISSNGVVTFTDGTNDVTPNQTQCEAYGYTYNSSTGVCEAFTYTTKLPMAVINTSNIIKGQGNNTGSGTTNTHILGQNNSTKGPNHNDSVIGSSNEVKTTINNSLIVGTKASPQRS